MPDPKEWVKERYGAVARQEAAGCGGAPCCGDPASETARRIGYSEAEVGSVPEGANRGMGCGNPLAIAGISGGETVLDLGSGAGFDAFLAADRVGPSGRVIGVDITPEMIEAARANAAAGGYSNVEFRLGDIEHLPVEDGSVDLVISNCVLNLVPDKGAAFREIARVLKPGGRAAISDIVLDGELPEALRGDAGGWCSCVSGAISRGDYLDAFAQAGIVDIQVTSEADAAAILASDCCGSGAAEADLVGVVTSLHITGRRPA